MEQSSTSVSCCPDAHSPAPHHHPKPLDHLHILPGEAQLHEIHLATDTDRPLRAEADTATGEEEKTMYTHRVGPTRGLAHLLLVDAIDPTATRNRHPGVRHRDDEAHQHEVRRDDGGEALATAVTAATAEVGHEAGTRRGVDRGVVVGVGVDDGEKDHTQQSVNCCRDPGYRLHGWSWRETSQRPCKNVTASRPLVFQTRAGNCPAVWESSARLHFQ